MIEENNLGVIQNTSDASVSVVVSKLHARVVFLRPSILHGVMQLSFLWSEGKLWKRNGLSAVSLQLCISSSQTEVSRAIGTRCNCIEFRSKQECMLIHTIWSEPAYRGRLISFGKRSEKDL